MLGASFDSVEDNLAFKDKFDLPFSLLCDTTRELGMAYHACDSADASHAARISILIGPDHRVVRTYTEVDARSHPQLVLDEIG